MNGSTYNIAKVEIGDSGEFPGVVNHAGKLLFGLRLVLDISHEDDFDHSLLSHDDVVVEVVSLFCT